MERTRLVIVRRGATELFETLRRRFVEDPQTCVMWDKRSVDRRAESRRVPNNRRRRERRQPLDPSILAERGFFVTYESRVPRVVSRVASP